MLAKRTGDENNTILSCYYEAGVYEKSGSISQCSAVTRLREAEPPPPVYDAAAHTARSCLVIPGRTAREGLPWWLRCKESACNAGDLGSIRGLGRPTGEGNGYPLQYCCLENSVGRGAWWVPWGRKELDMTEQPTQRQQQSM